jgi:glycosyltransferase involved in cell wall biosynthesis
MKIGMVLENEYSNDPRVIREAELLAANDFDISILAVKKPGYEDFEVLNGVKIYRVAISKFVLDKFRPLTPNFFGYYQVWKKYIKSFINERKIKVLHVHDLPLMKLCIDLAAEYKIPVIGDFHENYSEAIKMYYWANTWKGKLLINFKKWDSLQEYSVKKLDKIVVVADETIDLFKKKYNRNKNDFYSVDNSIDIEQFEKTGINDKLNEVLKRKYSDFVVFGFTGAILPNRGLQHLIKLLPEYKSLKLKLVIVGKGQLKKELVAFAEKAGISHMIDWYDWQHFENLLTFTQNFDVGLTRLEDNLQNSYTTPNKVFQYMYMKKPVLTADSLPMVRIVGKTNSGLVFRSGDKESLKNCFEKLYYDKELRMSLGENGRKVIEQRYNWKQTQINLLDLYRIYSNQI